MRILLLAFAALAACSGRPSLHEDMGRSFERVWQAQADGQPREKLAPFTATEAAIVMGNHKVRYDKGGAAVTAVTGGGGGAGQLNPATTDLSALGLGGGATDGGGGPGDRQIRLEPK